MKKLEILIAIILLAFSIGFNLNLYRLEPTAKVDPNDNAFQFGLVDRTNQIWDFAKKECWEHNFLPGGVLTYPLCHLSYLADHWVPNWAVGYNLPNYYSHTPQIAIVASFRFLSLFHSGISLFGYYHVVIYLLLCLFPISMFLALRVIGLSWFSSGIGALLATNLSTDGLYGLDPSSFLWRGYGLSSQLFAMIFLPLAVSYAWRYLTSSDTRYAIRDKKNIPLSLFMDYIIRVTSRFPLFAPFVSRISYHVSPRDFWLAIIFITMTTAGHLGIGMITMITLGVMAFVPSILSVVKQEPFIEILESAKNQFVKLALIAGVPLFFLSYWILPTMLGNNFHNISFWDPVWKFDSYGFKETIIRLLNGDLFDFGRPAIITTLTLLGVLAGLLMSKSHTSVTEKQIANHKSLIVNQYVSFSILFIFWLLMYFGRTTWGGIVDLIPGMKEFHLSRFIVPVHLLGMFLAPIAIEWIMEVVLGVVVSFRSRFAGEKSRPSLNNLIGNSKFIYSIRVIFFSAILIGIIPPVLKYSEKYNELNDKLIIQGNGNFDKVKDETNVLFSTIKNLPGARVFAGRGGWWGKDFKVAETPMYMHLSTYGVPTTLWLPETWSPNSDTEQYFREDKEQDYDLYNMRYVAALSSQPPLSFWKELKKYGSWTIYEVPTSGYFTTGTRVAKISTTKERFVNIVHLWIQSDYPQRGLYPEISFTSLKKDPNNIPVFGMVDEVNFRQLDGKELNIWSNKPSYMSPQELAAWLSGAWKPKVEELTDAGNKNIKIVKPTITGKESNIADMVYSQKISVPEGCKECLVILKQSYHPSWRAWVDGKPARTIITFPFFVGVPVTPGNHTITLTYQPSALKVILLTLSLLTVFLLILTPLYRRFKRDK